MLLAREGADIVGIDIAAPVAGIPYDPATPEDLAETKRLVEAEGRRAILERADVRDLDAQKAVVKKATSELGGLDIVVANAGICIPAAWDATTPEVFQDTMDINVTGVWNTVMAAAPSLVERGGGAIVITSSYAGKKMQPFMVHYTTSKHALVGMTRAFAAELGQHDISRELGAPRRRDDSDGLRRHAGRTRAGRHHEPEAQPDGHAIPEPVGARSRGHRADGALPCLGYRARNHRRACEHRRGNAVLLGR